MLIRCTRGSGLNQTKPLISLTRRSTHWCLPLFLCLVSYTGVLLSDSPIDQLTKSVEFEHNQAFLELAAKPLPEACLFLFICFHMISSILRQGVESLSVLRHSIIALFQSQELIELPSNNPCRDMMCPESFLELIPRKPSASREHSYVIIPPRTCRTSELLSCK